MIFKWKRIIWCSLTFITVLALIILLPVQESLHANATMEEQVLVIDAGHGGEDGGAVASNGTAESDINLDIALRLELLASFWGIPTVMTRETAEIHYPDSAETIAAKKKADQNARIALIQNTPGAILMSIHQNFYPSDAPWGIQVFYSTVSGSAELAEITQENMTSQLAPDNRRLAAAIDENIYLMRKVQCPAVLVECGFLSNPKELQKLETEAYRLELAAVLLASYQQYTEGITK